MLNRNIDRTRQLLFAAIPAIPAEPGCRCHEARPAGAFD
jgi:hypothetical protein